MKKPIATTFALVAGAVVALAGCTSISEHSAQDDAAMMLNYPYVNVSGTVADYPYADIAAMDNEPTEDVAAVSLYYPYTSFSADAGEASNGLMVADGK
jgi:hypothetical protein